MANFNFNITDSNFSLALISEDHTTCSTLFTYEVTANQNDQIEIDLNASAVEYCKYVSDGVETAFINSTTLYFNGSLRFSFSIQNSGVPGFFKSSEVKVTQVSNGTELKLTAIRPNDTDECLSVISNDDKHYTHDQGLPALVWTVQHGLDKYPTVAVIDTGDTVVIGEVTYVDLNNLTITFNYAFAGKAYAN